MKPMSLRIVLSLMFAVWSAPAQTNALAPAVPGEMVQIETNSGLIAQRYEQTRVVCIQARRIICGKIMKVLPDGLVIESGYTNLMRPPLNKTWLIPGTVVATRPANLVEANEPGTVCVGLVFLADQPKTRGKARKPKVYDYVNVEGFPMGRYTYASIGGIQRTVRRFSTKLVRATQWNFDQSQAPATPSK
jgi:hypothetical protein